MRIVLNKVRVDTCITRISSKNFELFSLCRVRKGIVASSQIRRDAPPLWSNQEWDDIAGFEALLFIIKIACVYFQNEKKYLGGYTIWIKNELLRKLRRGDLMMIDTANVVRGQAGRGELL